MPDLNVCSDSSGIGPSPCVGGESLAWYRALTLTERVSAGEPLNCRSAQDYSEGHSGDETADADRLAYCLSSWRSQKPFDNPEYFQKRLGLANLTERDLTRLIDESPSDLRERIGTVPGWMVALETALGATPSFAFHDLLTDRLSQKSTIGFLDVAAPFIDRALRAVTAGAIRLSRQFVVCPFDPPSVAGLLWPHLAKTLLRIVSRTMVLELNVARVSGTLSGSTPEDRFRSFIVQLRDPQYLRALLEEYPVLARLLVETTDCWVAASLEFLDRLARDFPTLETTFAGHGSLGPLVSAVGGLSDPHHGRRSVIIARFGSGVRIVYKPKSLAIDEHFQDLLRWVAAAGFGPGFRTLAIVNRGTYGWIEHAEQASCHTCEDVSRYYERAGGLLALLYVTEGTDLHAGNVIACGEYPVLVDLEALFHPHRSPALRSDHVSADAVASRWLRSSVLRTGLLPERQWGNSEHDGVDVSGLGGPEGQVTPHDVPDWDAAGTDTMRLVRRRKTIAADANRPLLNGRGVDVLDYGTDLVRGFRAVYTLLVEQRDAFLSPTGPLRAFSGDAVSVFLRSSRTYRKLLRESYHPDVLRDALDRDRLFDLLWMEVPHDPQLTWVIQSERNDLWNGDIPCFSAQPDSRALYVGHDETVPDFFFEASLSAAERVVNRLNADDCARQVWLIEASLASLHGQLARPHVVRHRAASHPSVPERLLEAARTLGGRLGELAVRSGGRASWIGVDSHDQRQWSVAKAGLDLESGIPGIALFLAYLGTVTGDERPTGLAREAHATMQELIEERSASITRIGGFDGLGGMIYALSHLASLWTRTDLWSAAFTLMAQLRDRIDDDDDFDVYGGAAGCILALRSLRRCVPSDQVRATAIRCGDHLIRSSVREAGGLTWPGLSDGDNRRVGLAYGAAGIALALFELHAWSGDTRFREAAELVLDDERQRLTCVGQSSTWTGRANPDDRNHAEAPSSVLAWSAWSTDPTTLALAHLSRPSDSRDPARRSTELTDLAATIVDRGFGSNHSLCHGSVGSLECLSLAAAALGDEGLRHEADRQAGAILADIEHHGWRCGTPLDVETPGLALGLAGIGYGLLRAARPDVVPSVLALEPPRPIRRRGYVG